MPHVTAAMFKSQGPCLTCIAIDLPMRLTHIAHSGELESMFGKHYCSVRVMHERCNIIAI